MPTWSEWESLNSQGVIQAPLPSIYFQYRYAITERVYFTDPWSLSMRVPGVWELRILDPNDVVIFHQTVEIRFDVFYYMDQFFGTRLLTFFAWTYAASAEVITTTVPDPVETMGDMAEQGYMQPGGGSTFTADYGYITESTANGDTGDGFWYSPMYALAIPVGSRFEVIRHTVGVPLITPREAAIQIRTATGGTFGSLTDTADFLRIADPTGGDIMQRYLVAPSGMFTRGPMLTSASEPSVWKDATNKMWLGARKSLAFRLYSSEDDGYAWSDEEQIMWPDGYTNPHATGGMGDRVFTVANKGGTVWFRSNADKFTGQVKVGDSAEPHQIQQGRTADELFVFPTAGGTIYRSSDGGRTWTEVATTQV